jgi:superfamily II DNA or RNA helicase
MATPSSIERPLYEGTKFPPPRALQVTAHEALRQGAREGHRAQMLMSPTGSGKTYLGLRTVHEATLKNRRTLFLCDRITLINQTSDTADRYGLADHGIIQADHWRFRPSASFQIASAQTLQGRGWPEALDVVIIDEAHTQLKVWVDYLNSWKDKPISEGPRFIGLSATPFSKGLGKLFTNLINAASMHELIELGVLVPLRVFTCTPTNMKDAATSGGEWTDAAAAERGLAIVGDVVSEWTKYGEGRKTIVFGATIAHCEELCKQFNESGVMAAVFCAITTKAEREQILLEYRKPQSLIRVLISVEALAKGFDVEDVGCIVDCRPLRKSLSTFVQMVGRGLRSSPVTGKKDCILLDHTGNIVRFLRDFEEIYFNGLGELDMGEKYDKTVRQDPEEDERPGCPKCGYKPFGKRCMACGHERQVLGNVEHGAASGMKEIFIGKKRLAAGPVDLFNQICSYARHHGNPDTAKGRSAHIYRRIMGAFPAAGMRFERAPEVPVSAGVLGQIKHQMIAFFKSKQA